MMYAQSFMDRYENRLRDPENKLPQDVQEQLLQASVKALFETEGADPRVAEGRGKIFNSFILENKNTMLARAMDFPPCLDGDVEMHALDREMHELIQELYFQSALGLFMDTMKEEGIGDTPSPVPQP